MALFVLASKDGWVNIMYTGLDAVGVDQQVCTIFLLFPFIEFTKFTKDQKLWIAVNNQKMCCIIMV